MFLTAKVLNGNILVYNDNLPSQQPFLAQRFPDKGLSILTVASSLKILFLQPGNTADMAKRDWQIQEGNSQKKESGWWEEDGKENCPETENPLEVRWDDAALQTNQLSPQTSASPEYKNKTRVHKGINNCGVGMSWSGILEKEKLFFSKRVRWEKSIQQVDTQVQQDGGSLNIDHCFSLNICCSSIPSHLVTGTTPTLTTPPEPSQREVWGTGKIDPAGSYLKGRKSFLQGPPPMFSTTVSEGSFDLCSFQLLSSRISLLPFPGKASLSSSPKDFRGMEDAAEVPRALAAVMVFLEGVGMCGQGDSCLQLSHTQLEFSVTEIWLQSPGCEFKSHSQCCLPELQLLFHVPGRWTRRRWHVLSQALGEFCFFCSHLTATCCHWHLSLLPSVSPWNDHSSLCGKFSCSEDQAVLLVPCGKDRKWIKRGFKTQIEMMGWNKFLVWKHHENIILDFGMLKIRSELHARIFQAGPKKRESNRKDTEIYKTMKGTERVVIFSLSFLMQNLGKSNETKTRNLQGKMQVSSSCEIWSYCENPHHKILWC